MVLDTLLSRDLLIDAYKFYSRGDARAQEALDVIFKRNDMAAAVKACLEKAKNEEEPSRQNLCVQAACFGKKFYPGVAIEEYQSACRQIRVMNILRAENIDPNVNLETAIGMLISWKNFELALWIVKYLKPHSKTFELVDSDIKLKWCEFLIGQRQLKDDQVASRVQKILGRSPKRVSYADVANKAIEFHRTKLAIKLIENENQSLKQIPLLLNLKQHDLVLAQALASCDSNLIYMTIFKLKESILSEIPFLELLKKHRLAYSYYCNFLAVIDIQKLIMISHKDNSLDAELYLCLLANRIDSALSVAKKMRSDFLVQQINTSIKLTKFQAALPSSSNVKKTPWTGLSISDTIINLIANGDTEKAREAQKKFDMSERKFKVLEQIATNTLPNMTIQS